MPSPSVKIELRLALYTNRGEPAGFRLQKGQPLPIERFDFALDDLETARDHLVRLQAYIDGLEAKKAPKR